MAGVAGGWRGNTLWQQHGVTWFLSCVHSRPLGMVLPATSTAALLRHVTLLPPFFSPPTTSWLLISSQAFSAASSLSPGKQHATAAFFPNSVAFCGHGWDRLGTDSDDSGRAAEQDSWAGCCCAAAACIFCHTLQTSSMQQGTAKAACRSFTQRPFPCSHAYMEKKRVPS